MTNESSDLLRNAAAVWKKMSEFSYLFTYGYKNKLYSIQLLFSSGKISAYCRLSVSERYRITEI